jgi:hypothetical protein
MNVPKRLCPHLYEFKLLQGEGDDIRTQMYLLKNERVLNLECKMIVKANHYRKKNLGTDKEIHMYEKNN